MEKIIWKEYEAGLHLNFLYILLVLQRLKVLLHQPQIIVKIDFFNGKCNSKVCIHLTALNRKTEQLITIKYQHSFTFSVAGELVSEGTGFALVREETSQKKIVLWASLSLFSPCWGIRVTSNEGKPSYFRHTWLVHCAAKKEMSESRHSRPAADEAADESSTSYLLVWLDSWDPGRLKCHRHAWLCWCTERI